MNPNLKWKALFIFAVILFCIYFLFGYPVFPTSVARMKDNFSKQIKLGLDLQGGTHLILQVQVQEAIAQETDTTVDRLTTLLRSKNIHYDEVRRVDDTHILVRNVDPAQLSQFRDIYNAQFATDWDMSAAAGDRNGYTWTLRTSAIARIQESTMTQSLETDRKSTRLNSSHDQISYAVFCLKKKKRREPLLLRPRSRRGRDRRTSTDRAGEGAAPPRLPGPRRTRDPRGSEGPGAPRGLREVPRHRGAAEGLLQRRAGPPRPIRLDAEQGDPEDPVGHARGADPSRHAGRLRVARPLRAARRITQGR